jgi:hypothetical protein
MCMCVDYCMSDSICKTLRTCYIIEARWLAGIDEMKWLVCMYVCTLITATCVYIYESAAESDRRCRMRFIILPERNLSKYRIFPSITRVLSLQKRSVNGKNHGARYAIKIEKIPYHLHTCVHNNLKQRISRK